MDVLLSTLAAAQLLGAQAPAAETELQAVQMAQDEVFVDELQDTVGMKWYYRVYLGKRQKRLWSSTLQIWLSDWMDF